MSKFAFTFVSISLLALSACGASVSAHTGADSEENSGGTSESNSSESYSYSFDYNGCKTGKQSATSRTGYCQNLTNDRLNHHCAEWIRKDSFDKSRCTDLGVNWDDSSDSADEG